MISIAIAADLVKDMRAVIEEMDKRDRRALTLLKILAKSAETAYVKTIAQDAITILETDD